jgi:hypothetical protein
MEPKIKCENCDTEYLRRRFKCPICDQIGVSKLYKYVSYNERSLSILINKQIWSPKAKSLNDPSLLSNYKLTRIYFLNSWTPVMTLLNSTSI